MAWPLVGVSPVRYAKGAENLSVDDIQSMVILPLDQALATEWVTDAHLSLYQLVQPSGEVAAAWPRINKVALNQIEQAGGLVQVTVLGFDYDLPGKVEWTQEARDDFERKLIEAGDYGLPLALQFSYLYYTAHGAHFLYVLSEPLLPDDAEGVVRGILRDFLSFGIKLDSLVDWTRLFRLPRVERDGLRTSGQAYFEDVTQGHLLDPQSVVPGEASTSSQYANLERLALPMPTDEWARSALTQVNGHGSVVQSWWYKQSSKQLRGRECFPALFQQAPLASSGERNSAIQRLVGEAIAFLYQSVRGTSPELIYALFFESLEQLNAQDPDDPEDFRVTGWQAILQYWAKETAKVQHEQEVLQQQQGEFQKNQQTLTETMLGGARTWAGESIPADPQQAVWWLGEHLIAATLQHFHILKPNGYYDHVGVPKQLLLARIRELRVDSLMPLEKIEDGRTKPTSAQELVDRHATTVSIIEGTAAAPDTHIKNLGTKNATLVHRIYARKDNLVPTFDVDVDLWLRMLGGDSYQALCGWIGHALNFEGGPICALSLAGSAGCGKKMFYQGLAECIDTEIIASSKEFGHFQGLLMRTPWLVINEGITNLKGGMHPADTFRALVGGDPVYVEPKFKEQMLVRNPVRVMFFANNADVVQTLTGNRDLSPEDREALALRIMHIDVDSKASQWLRTRGGLGFTQGWIAPDAGGESEYRIARHFLHLYVNRPQVMSGNRLLVEGNMTSELIQNMATRSGSAPQVVECLIKMIEAESQLDGLHIEGVGLGSRILVTTSAIVDFFRGQDFPDKARLNARIVGTVLKGLAASGHTDNAVVVETSRGPKRARWREVDAGLLYHQAVEHGYRCKRLEAIAMGRERVEKSIEDVVNQVTQGESHV